MARFLRLFAVIAVVALIAAACGDSGDEGGDNGGGDGQTTVTAGSSDSDDTLVTLGTLIEDIPGIDDDCIAVANVFASLFSVSGALSGQVAFDPDEAQALFDEAASQLPSELEDDIQVMADGMIAFYQAIADAGLDFSDPNALPSAEQLAALEAASDAIDTDEFNAASDALSAWADAECTQFGN